MLKILGRNTSSNVQKVLLTCLEAGIEFERVDIGGKYGGNDKPDYLNLNPTGRIPTIIEDNGFVLWESNSVCRYLANTRKATRIWPRDLKTRAAAERWMDWQLSMIAPVHVTVYQGLVRLKPNERDMDKINAAAKQWGTLLGMLDGYLKEQDYVAGDKLTIGDLVHAPFAHRYFSLDIERPSLPHVEAWYERLKERESFQKVLSVPFE